MEYSLESNERTLVMFDSVCAGLTSCLALVHADIRQMTEHRNRLAQIEQEQIRAKCRSAQELFVMSKDKFSSGEIYPTNKGHHNNSKNRKSKSHRHPVLAKNICNNTSSQHQLQVENSEDSFQNEQEQTTNQLSDPHYLASLKLLDKRLAESFSQAFNLNDQQRSSIVAKQQAQQHSRPSIFQVLLGKTLSRKVSASNISKKNKNSQNINNNDHDQPVDNKLVIDDINRQIRLAMQYIKQLEAHLFKVEDLRPKYEMHLKMGLVVKSNNNNHYNSSSSLKSAKSKISNSTLNSTSTTNINTSNSNNNKTTIREFIDNINKIEQEFESFMGSFLLAIEDIQGFARVCQGDVFEITIKYGEAQKFKTRISVLKDNKQKCDNRQTVFKARIADILAIKAYECKGLGKRVLLGHKLCETRDLFTAQSQLMTISLNQTGSIKLNLIVTWNPLHMAPNSTFAAPGSDISHISLPPTPISSSTLSSLSSVPSINGTTTTINIKSPNRARLNDSFDNCESQQYYAQQNQNSHHHNNNSYYQHNNQHQQHQVSLYQSIDPTYGINIYY